MGLCYSIFATKSANILLLGLDGAGKTTILYRLKKNKLVQTVPTTAPNMEEMTPLEGVAFKVWDLGGNDTCRKDVWHFFYPHVEGLMYIVDSNDKERIEESRKELFRVLGSAEMAGVPVVVVANKQDFPNAVRKSKLELLMRLHEITSNKWCIMDGCATTGEGIFESLREMAKMFNECQTKSS